MNQRYDLPIGCAVQLLGWALLTFALASVVAASSDCGGEVDDPPEATGAGGAELGPCDDGQCASGMCWPAEHMCEPDEPIAWQCIEGAPVLAEQLPDGCTARLTALCCAEGIEP
jgi:hypothetical protein